MNADEAKPCFRANADTRERATFCRELAERREAAGRYEEALALYDRAACLFEDLGEIEEQAAAWIAEGELHLRLGDDAKALECFDSTALLESVGLNPALTLRAERGSALAIERSFSSRQPNDEH